jgi:hypothetical protein
MGLFPGFDPAYISDSQSTNIRNRSNSAMEEDLDDSADTTTPDALTTDTRIRKKQRFHLNRKEKKMAELYHSTPVHPSQYSGEEDMIRIFDDTRQETLTFAITTTALDVTLDNIYNEVDNDIIDQTQEPALGQKLWKGRKGKKQKYQRTRRRLNNIKKRIENPDITPKDVKKNDT